jgi:ribonuclease HI
MVRYELYTDGATRPHNPGPSGYGAVLYREGSALADDSGFLGDGITNNQAEYAGMVSGLRLARNYTRGGDRLRVLSDSKLVVNQVMGAWLLNSRKLYVLHQAAQAEVELLRQAGVEVSLEHVAGHQGILGNEAADALAGSAVDLRVAAPEEIVSLVNAQHEVNSSPKGSQKLGGLVTSWLVGRGHRVFDLAGGDLAAAHDYLKRLRDPTAAVLANFPEIGAVVNGRMHLIAVATGFRIEDDKGLITVDEEALTACQRLASIGLSVLVVHKPHGNARWRTFRDFGWGSGALEIPATCFEAGKIEVLQRYNTAKWAPFVSFRQEGAKPFIAYVEDLEK